MIYWDQPELTPLAYHGVAAGGSLTFAPITYRSDVP